jgi:hypothetical protein
VSEALSISQNLFMNLNFLLTCPLVSFYGVRCAGRDAIFDILATKYPEEDLNQLGKTIVVGWSLAAVAVTVAISLTFWVVKYRHIQTVRTLQPIFLVTILLGVLVMALALLPLGIDDGLASQQWCDISCMAVPWLLSLGFTAAMSALFSKLWRIHRLFRASHRHVVVLPKDVITPFAVMFSLNFAALLIWTLVSPLRFQRFQIDGNNWNSYGTCRSEDETFGNVITAVVVSINAACLLFASYTAFLVRDIGEEFAESKSLMLALFSWLQLFVVAGPMLFLIDQDNVTADYFLKVGVIFAICMSMLGFIFVPIVWQKNHAMATLDARRRESSRDTATSTGPQKSSKYTLQNRGVHISGLPEVNEFKGFPDVRYSSKVSQDLEDIAGFEGIDSFNGDVDCPESPTNSS